MKAHKLSWQLSLGYCFLGILIPLAVSFLGVRNRLDTSQPVQDGFVTLDSKKILKQTFTANHDYINIIILNLKNPGLANQGEFLFSLDSEEGDVLAERPFSGYNIGDPSVVRFQFDPIASSKNKKFNILIKELVPATPSIGVASSRERGLNYLVYYRTIDKKTAMIDLLNNLKRIFLSDLIFFVFWLFLIFSILLTKVKLSKRI